MQGIVKFRTAILNVDPCAKFFADGELLKVTHSRCGGKFTQNSLNDISNFQDHVGICQSIHPGAATPVRPTKLYSRCPGFGFEELCGEVYGSLSHHERQQVKSATEAAGFVWVDSRGKWSLIAGSCLRKIPSRNELIQPCQSCLDAVELSNIKGNLLRITSKPKYEFINPFSAMDATTTGTREHEASDVSLPHRKPRSTLANKPHIGENLAPMPTRYPSPADWGVAIGLDH